MTFPSLYYFLFYGALSFLFPFLALFYKSQGLSGAQIGLLAAISPLIGMIGSPLWNGAADATRRHKLILGISTLGVAAVTFIFPGVTSFAGLVVMAALFSFFYSPGASLVDSAVMLLMGEHKERYGRVRLWGTVGYGLIAPFAAIWVGAHGLQWAFWGFALITLLTVLAILPIPFHQGHTGGSFFGGMRSLFGNRPWMVFLVMVFIAAIGMAGINTYLFVYMKNLGISDALMGLALTISTISEVPVLFFSDRILRRYGPRGMLIIAMLVIGLRLVSYFFVTQAWIILCIQMVHGLTFATIYTAGVQFADQVSPPGMKATAQGMFGGVLLGVGAAAGGFLGGFLMDHFTPGGMYAILGSITLLGLAAFLLFERRLDQKNGL